MSANTYYAIFAGLVLCALLLSLLDIDPFDVFPEDEEE